MSATLPTQIFAERIEISGFTIKSKAEMEIIRYEFYRKLLSRVNYGSLLSRLNIKRIDKKFLFISEDLEFHKKLYVPKYGAIIPESEEIQLIRAFDVQIDTEISWLYFEKAGFIAHFDIVDRTSITNDISHNYDYIITMRSSSNDLRDVKSVSNRKTEYFVQHVKTGSESRIAETIGSPILLSQLDDVAIKISNFVTSFGANEP